MGWSNFVGSFLLMHLAVWLVVMTGYFIVWRFDALENLAWFWERFALVLSMGLWIYVESIDDSPGEL